MKTHNVTLLLCISLFTQTTHAMESKDGIKDLVTQHPYVTGAAIVLPLAVIGWWNLCKPKADNPDARLHINVLSTNGKIGYSILNEGLSIPLKSKANIETDGLFAMLQLTYHEYGRLLSALADAAVKHSDVYTTFNSDKTTYYAKICPTVNDCNNEFDFNIKVKKYVTKFPLSIDNNERTKTPKNRLNFSLDESKSIISWSQVGDSICTLSEVRLGNTFLNVLPLDQENSTSLLGALKLADAQQKSIKRELSIEDKCVIAKIVPLKWEDECQTRDYFVQLTQKNTTK